MGFTRVYLEPGEEREVSIELEVDRYLPVLDREWEWVLEKGEYVFVLAEHGGLDAEVSGEARLVCV